MGEGGKEGREGGMEGKPAAGRKRGQACMLWGVFFRWKNTTEVWGYVMGTELLPA